MRMCVGMCYTSRCCESCNVEHKLHACMVAACRTSHTHPDQLGARTVHASPFAIDVGQCHVGCVVHAPWSQWRRERVANGVVQCSIRLPHHALSWCVVHPQASLCKLHAASPVLHHSPLISTSATTSYLRAAWRRDQGLWFQRLWSCQSDGDPSEWGVSHHCDVWSSRA